MMADGAAPGTAAGPATPPLFPLQGRRIWVAGHRGLVGSAVVRRLAREGCTVLTADRQTLDLRRQGETEAWLRAQRPDAIILAAATVGGILANEREPATFLHDNLAIETTVIEAAFRVGVSKLLFLGSSCIYPRDAAQPIVEEALLTGPLEPTNEWYAIAKIAGIKLCQAFRLQHGCDFISVQPTNLYGPGASFDPARSHVIPALIAKAHAARQAGDAAIEVWGSGTPRREFLYVDDLADALVFVLQHYSGLLPLNIGCGEDITIAELARMICQVVGFAGDLHFDASKPDGMPRKLLDVSRLHALGWRAQTPLATGLRATYRWYLDHLAPLSSSGD